MGQNSVAIAGSLLIAATAHAASKPPAASPAVGKLLDCRSLAEAGERLACFDREAMALAGDVDAKRVIVVDKAQVRQAQRERFGLAAPGLDLFAGKDGERLSTVSSTVSGAGTDPSGKWVITLADGSRWHQIDDYSLGRSPRAGQPAVITRAAMGSFRISIAGQGALRVRRER